MRHPLVTMLTLVAVAGLVAGGAGASWAVAEKPVTIPKGTPPLYAPAVITTCGQSPGALMIKAMCDEAKVACDEVDLLKPAELAAAPGKYRTLIVTMGTSRKGMGAARVSITAEVSRALAVIAEARKQRMVVVGVQLEGPPRRVDETDEASIRAVTPQSALLIIRSDVNKDGYFTKVAAEKEIPLILINEALDVKYLLSRLFKKP